MFYCLTACAIFLLVGCGGNLADPSHGVVSEPTFVMNGGSAEEDTHTYHCQFRSSEACDSRNGCDCAALPGDAHFDTQTGILRWTPSDSASAPYSVTITPNVAHSTDCAYFVVDPLDAESSEIDLPAAQCP